MKNIDENIKLHILKYVPNIKNDNDFWKLIEYVYENVIHINNEDFITFEDFLQLRNTTAITELYKTFSIKKRSGKKRIIFAPNNILKKLQKSLNVILQIFYTPDDNVCGFVLGHSIVDGVKQHINKKYVYNIDLKDFFDYIALSDVECALKNIFSWNNTKYQLPSFFAKLCCCNKVISRIDKYGKKGKIMKYVLPQGAPTSPILTNIVCRNMDKQLASLAQKYNATYTRYADDITFSSDNNNFNINSSFCQAMREIIEKDNNFLINKKKTRLQISAYRQEVTGIVVNKKVNVRKYYIKQLRMWLYLWEHYGLERVQSYFIKYYSKQSGCKQRTGITIENVLGGKLAYLKMLIGKKTLRYMQLHERYYSLINKNNAKIKHEANSLIITKPFIQLEIPFYNYI